MLHATHSVELNPSWYEGTAHNWSKCMVHLDTFFPFPPQWHLFTSLEENAMSPQCMLEWSGVAILVQTTIESRRVLNCTDLRTFYTVYHA